MVPPGGAPSQHAKGHRSQEQGQQGHPEQEEVMEHRPGQVSQGTGDVHFQTQEVQQYHWMMYSTKSTATANTYEWNSVLSSHPVRIPISA